jgi:hypothetical protein
VSGHRFYHDVAETVRPLPFSQVEAVDWLEEGDPTAGPQHPEELIECALLVGDVDQDGTCRDDIDGEIAEIGRARDP